MEKTVQMYEGKAKKYLQQMTNGSASYLTKTTPPLLTARKKAQLWERAPLTTA